MAMISRAIDAVLLTEIPACPRQDARGLGLFAGMRNAVLRRIRNAAVRALDLETEFEILD